MSYVITNKQNNLTHVLFSCISELRATTINTSSPDADEEGAHDVSVPNLMLSTEYVPSSSNEDGLDEDYIPTEDYRHDDEDEEEIDEYMVTTKKRKKPANTASRQRWSMEEVDELLELFKKDFETNTLPGQQRIEKIMQKSKINNGKIYKRKRDNIKKKLSNMMIKRRAEKHD